MTDRKHVYVITLILPDGLNYFTGFERHPEIPGLIMNGWNIYRKYSKVFVDKQRARLVCSRIRRDMASRRAKVMPILPFGNTMNIVK